MVIVWGVVAILGGVITVVAAWGTSPILALLLAPFGGSLSVLIGAGLLYALRTRRARDELGRAGAVVNPGA